MGWRDDYDDRDIDLGRRDRSRRADTPDHPGWGLASFLIAIFSGIGMLVVGVFIGVLAAMEERELDDKDPRAIILGLGFMAGLVASLVGLVLGCMSLSHSNRNVAFAVVGIVLNAIIVLGVLGLIVLGLAAG